MSERAEALSNEQAAVYLGVGLHTLETMRRRKLIKPTRVGRRVLWRLAELDRFLALCTVEEGRRSPAG